MKYRSKGCKKCGGSIKKMQDGGSNLTPEEIAQALQDIENMPGNDTQYFQTGFQYNQATGQNDAIPYSPMEATYEQAQRAEQFTTTNPMLPGSPKAPKNSDFLQSLGMGILGARTALGELAGRIERNRQNEYDYLQQATLGQMNPMPVKDYQPNPYSLYAKYGGSIKEHMKKGGLTPNKAREILHDGTAQGHPLTPKQRRFFGAKSKGHTNYRGK